MTWSAFVTKDEGCCQLINSGTTESCFHVDTEAVKSLGLIFGDGLSLKAAKLTAGFLTL